MILTDATPDQVNLTRMVKRFQTALAQEVEVVNLPDLDIKGVGEFCDR